MIDLLNKKLIYFQSACFWNRKKKLYWRSIRKISHVPFYSYPDAVGNSDWARWKVLARPGADRNASKNISTATAVWSSLLSYDQNSIRKTYLEASVYINSIRKTKDVVHVHYHDLSYICILKTSISNNRTVSIEKNRWKIQTVNM